MRKRLHAFDKEYVSKIQSWSRSLEPIMEALSVVGQPVFTFGVGLVVAMYGLLLGSDAIWLAGFATLTTLVVGVLLKLTFRRNRPRTLYVQHMRFDTYSLPSGHAVGGVVAYGLLATLSLELVDGLAALFLALLFIAIALGIGLSRVYLGAHYPSDVLAGWALGIVGLSVVVYILG